MCWLVGVVVGLQGVRVVASRVGRLGVDVNESGWGGVGCVHSVQRDTGDGGGVVMGAGVVMRGDVVGGVGWQMWQKCPWSDGGVGVLGASMSNMSSFPCIVG